MPNLARLHTRTRHLRVEQILNKLLSSPGAMWRFNAKELALFTIETAEYFLGQALEDLEAPHPFTSEVVLKLIFDKEQPIVDPLHWEFDILLWKEFARTEALTLQ